MNTAKRLLEDIKQKEMVFHCLFRFPYLYLILIDENFAGHSPDGRMALFASQLSWSEEEIASTAFRANLELEFLTGGEYAHRYSNPDERGQGWLREVAAGIAPQSVPALPSVQPKIPTLHFYGYKGGQARSTCLGFLARTLASDNWRVLVIDGDMEAPSLDILFDQRELALESTLLGVNAGLEIRPRRVFDPDLGDGYVDLLACRPNGNEYGLESIALSMGFAMDPIQITRCLRRIDKYLEQGAYDVLMIDHRAGLSPFVIPWLDALPGQTVVFARLDEQWRAAREYLPALLRRSADRAAVFVAFRGDSEAPESFLHRNQSQIEDLLSMLAHVVSQSVSPPSEISPGDLRPNFLVWPFDPSFRSARLPEATHTIGEIREATYELRRLTGIDGQRVDRGLSKSGARDRGDFVQTALWRELMRRDTPIRYVFGRKGTGKTRLLTEMQKRKLGEPLLVDRLDEGSFGLRACSRPLNAAIERFNLAPEAFFFMLFGCAFELPDTARHSLEKSVLTALEQGTDLSLNMERLFRATKGKPRRTFLLDGLETAFPTEKLSWFIEHLFRTLWAIQGDRQLSGQIEFRVFLRTDLASFGIQNREQQLEGQTAHLRWDYQSILNFALLRMLATQPSHMRFFGELFPDVVTDIRAIQDQLGHGAVAIERCEELLMRVFHKKLPRNNLLTTTFLRTYFTDTDAPILSLSSGGRESGATYYPRVFDAFLEVIARDGRARGAATLVDKHIDPELLLAAHEEAAELFLDQVRQELDFRVVLSRDEGQNRDFIKKLLTAFQGEATPFVPGELAEKLAAKMRVDGLAAPQVVRALDQMREIGMFENRPGAAAEWRVGRLFKSSLQMRYQR